MRLLEAARREASLCSRHRPATAGQRLPQTRTSDAVNLMPSSRGWAFAARSVHRFREGFEGFRSGRISQAELLSQDDFAVHDTIARFEATGSKVVTDGEQAKESVAIYPIHGLR